MFRGDSIHTLPRPLDQWRSYVADCEIRIVICFFAAKYVIRFFAAKNAICFFATINEKNLNIYDYLLAVYGDEFSKRM